MTAPFLNIATYRFVPLADLPALRQRLFDTAQSHGVRGTVLLADEGINLCLAGPADGIAAWLAVARAQPGLDNLPTKDSWSATQPFGRLKVKIKPEIIRIMDNWTGQVDHYTAAKSVCIELGNKKGKREFDRLQGCKVEFRKADGTLVEATDYSVVGANKINAQVPAGTTGNITETVVTMLINGALRSGSYTTILLP